MSLQLQNFVEGFIAKCAEVGVTDPHRVAELLVKASSCALAEEKAGKMLAAHGESGELQQEHPMARNGVHAYEPSRSEQYAIRR